jgi:hypothetical protein
VAKLPKPSPAINGPVSSRCCNRLQVRRLTR